MVLPHGVARCACTEGEGNAPDCRSGRRRRRSILMTDEAIPATGSDVEGESSRRAAILRSGAILGILFVVFVVILPRFFDYEAVLAAFRALTPAQIALMSCLAVVAFVLSGPLFSAVIPGLNVPRGTACYL